MLDPESFLGDSDEIEETEEENSGITDRILHRTDLVSLRLSLLNDISPALSEPVKRRVKALKKIQLKKTKIEAKFYEEVHLLECKYHHLYAPLYGKRSQIIRGIYEPNDLECEWESENKKKSKESENMKTMLKNENASDEEKNKEKKLIMPENTKGIPNFWLTIFKNVHLIAEMVQEYDEPILKHLEDIKVIFLEKNPMGFELEFHFNPNEYFTNKVLKKTYEMKCYPYKSVPFSFEGPEIYKCKGTSIDWYKGKNVTIKTIKQKQKHKSCGSVRTVFKTVENDSFFHFFSPPCNYLEMDEEIQYLLTSDFEIGHYIRERIVPHAILYYTGEALADEDYEEEVDYDDEVDEDEDDDLDDGELLNEVNNSQIKNTNPADCKQKLQLNKNLKLFHKNI